MTPNRQDGVAALQGGASRGRESAATFLQTYCPQPRASSPEERLLAAREAGGLAGYLLGLTVPLVFCSGLVALAVSPLFDVAVSRWFILAEGGGCAVLAVLAVLLTRTWQQRATVRQHLEPLDRQEQEVVPSPPLGPRPPPSLEAWPGVALCSLSLPRSSWRQSATKLAPLSRPSRLKG
jgi:hypothetical protein